MKHNQGSERSDSKLKPRYPRIQLLMKKRQQQERRFQQPHKRN